MYKENIYIAQVTDTNGMEFIKVGKSYGHPSERIKALQIGCPFPISLKRFFAIPSQSLGRNEGTIVSKIEKTIHSALDAYRISGEWFKLEMDAKLILNQAILELEKYEVIIEDSCVREEIKKILALKGGSNEMV